MQFDRNPFGKPTVPIPRPAPKPLAIAPGGHRKWAGECRPQCRRAGRIGSIRLQKALHACPAQSIEDATVVVLPSAYGAHPSKDDSLFQNSDLPHHPQATLNPLRAHGSQPGAAGQTAVNDVSHAAEQRSGDLAAFKLTLGRVSSTGWGAMAAFPRNASASLALANEQIARGLEPTQATAPGFGIRTSGALLAQESLAGRASETAICVIDAPWPDCTALSFHQALRWYAENKHRMSLPVSRPKPRTLRPARTLLTL